MISRFLHRYILSNKKVTIIVLACLAALIIGIVVWHNNSSRPKFLYGSEAESEEDFEKSLKFQDSDIKGMTKYDKLKVGLDYRDGSDTDGDGLTDKEEIEKYGTDPLKASTSGDLYSDKYKVEHDMDTSKKYDYTKKIKYKRNQCKEVSLDAKTPTDIAADISDITSDSDLSDFGISKVYAAYRIYNYGSSINIDVSDICDKNDIKPDDISVYIAKGDFIVKGSTKLEKCKTETDGNEISIDVDLDSSNVYQLFLSNKKSLMRETFRNFGIGSDDEEDTPVAVLEGWPLAFESCHLYYPKLDTEEETKAFAKQAIAWANQVRYDDQKLKYGDSHCSCVSQTTIDNMIKMKSFLLKSFSISSLANYNKENLNYLFYWYSVYDGGDYEAMLPDGTTDPETKSKLVHSSTVTGFDRYKDEFTFGNFGTKYAKGSCSGISHFVSYLFNNKKSVTHGSYKDSDGNTIKWDIRNDKDNKELLTPGISGYKNQYFVTSHSSDGNMLDKNLSDGEEEFVKMMEAFQLESNDKVNESNYRLIGDSQKPSWSAVEKVMKTLDSGKICNTGIMFRNGGLHEMNVYDYYQKKNGEVVFSIYDCNIPMDNSWTHTVRHSRCYLICKPVTDANGNKKFDYLYYPLKDYADYIASSESWLQESHSIVFFDENYNIFD